jgi:ABC-type transport system involved in multi-copper enzyme maturation permease subunit
MNAFLRKEIRLLLPSFVIALLLTFSFWLIPAEGAAPPVIRNSLFLFPFLLCPAVVMMMALNSFGREVSAGTFSNLLAQPVARARIWWTKAVLLAVALAVIFCAWWFSCLLCAPIEMSPDELRDTSVGTALFLLVTYSGGLWAVLLFRQVAVAFWFTLIVPGQSWRPSEICWR